MATDPTDQAACLRLAQRAVGGGAGWTPEQWAEQLTEDAMTRGTPARTYFRPYTSALAWLMNPERLSARTEGSVQEQYVSSQATKEWLEGRAAEWESALPPDRDGDGQADTFTGDLDFRGW